MNPALKFAVLLFLFSLVNVSSAEKDFGECEKIVREWARSSLEEEEVKVDKQTLRDLLYFLHVPRTGGRAYSFCLLKMLYPGSLNCPPSYDKLRFDPRKQKCKVLGTHDDYSVMFKLPREKTSVMTVLRNPIDRVFGAYEFSVEVAARFLVHPNLTAASETTKSIEAKNKGVSTLDIWPWMYLVPWMREDLFARRDARKEKGLRYVSSNDSYNMEEMAMPLQQFINEPLTLDMVHNGATFQVAGLTNNSYLAEAHEIRHCVKKFTILGEHVLQVAQKRLDNMLFVGLTEYHRESAELFGNMVGAQMISQIASYLSMEGLSKKKSEPNSLISDSELDSKLSNYHRNRISDLKTSENVSMDSVEGSHKKMTVGKLIEDYDVCISDLRKSQTVRRTNSLKKISAVNFSKEARLLVPEVVLQRIRSLNNLDIRLYRYAEDIFAKQKESEMHELVKTVMLENMFSDYYSIPLWQVILLATSIFLSLFLFVNARRRFSKVKI